MTRLTLKARVGPGGPVVTLLGRDAWALQQLHAANENGCTPIDHPAPRWSAYVHKLRKTGIVIETVHEAHGGQFAGSHGRYVLRTEITILEVEGGS